MSGVVGKLAGEICKATGSFDGRARFISDDKNIEILCYFKSGQKLKGPQLRVDFGNKTIEVRGQTFKAAENSYYMKACTDL